MVLQQKVVDGVDNLAVAVEQPVLPILVEVALIGQNLQKLSDLENDILGLGLLGVDVNIRVQVLENFEDQISQIEGVHLIESHQRDVLLEGRLVEQQHNLLYVLRLDGLLLGQRQRLAFVLHSKIYLNYETLVRFSSFASYGLFWRVHFLFLVPCGHSAYSIQVALV